MSPEVQRQRSTHGTHATNKSKKSRNSKNKRGTTPDDVHDIKQKGSVPPYPKSGILKKNRSDWALNSKTPYF